MAEDTPAVQAAKLKLRAATLELEAALLLAPASVRGCANPECPGPQLHPDGGCPMG